MSRRLGVIVLCTGNACRSQMAAAFLRQHSGDRLAVYSAGTEPAERVHELTVRVMKEKGIDLSGATPHDVRDYLGKVPVQTVIVVCDGANRTCPTVWPGAYERLFWPFEDPAAFTGGEEERLRRFREVRDAIEEKVVGWLDQEAMPRAAGSPSGETG